MIRESHNLANFRSVSVPLPAAEPSDRNGKSGPVSSLAKEGQAQKPSQVPVVNKTPFDPTNQLSGNWVNLQGMLFGMKPIAAVSKTVKPLVDRNDASEDAEEIDPETGQPKKSESGSSRPVAGVFQHYSQNDNPFDDHLHYRF
jgi:hypothetical protein